MGEAVEPSGGDRCSHDEFKVGLSEDEELRAGLNTGLARNPLAPRRMSSRLRLRNAFRHAFLLRPVARRGVLHLVVFAVTLLVLGSLWTGSYPYAAFEGIREYERRLPQHDLSLPFPEGVDGMYLWFSDSEVSEGGSFSETLQNLLLMSHLAYLANRSFVFEDYAPSRTRFPYYIDGLSLQPARVPLNAFISGPTAGGPIPASAPRAVSAKYWDVVCPESSIMRFNSSGTPKIHEGDALVDWWVAKLSATPARCVEVENDPPVFSRFLFGSKRVLSLWPSLVISPILRGFAWSPLVMSAISANLPLLTHSPTSFVPATIEGLVAIHLPRKGHLRQCGLYAKWGKLYMGFDQFSDLPDRFEPPKFGSMRTLDARERYYLEHCWPKIDDVVKKMRDVRMLNKHLRRVYVISDGGSWWMGRLWKALARDGWEDVRSSGDLQLSNEQRYISNAIDMAIAERAEVFVGNGFSSLTSNVVMLRTSDNKDPGSNRFW